MTPLTPSGRKVRLVLLKRCFYRSRGLLPLGNVSVKEKDANGFFPRTKRRSLPCTDATWASQRRLPYSTREKEVAACADHISIESGITRFVSCVLHVDSPKWCDSVWHKRRDLDPNLGRPTVERPLFTINDHSPHGDIRNIVESYA